MKFDNLFFVGDKIRLDFSACTNMDLRTTGPFWLLKHGIIKSYPSLQKNISTEIIVMGAGISGALTAWHLQKAGFSVVVVDRRHIGMGSTAASTALLQYEIDTPLRKLVKLRGEKDAIRSYQLCLQSIKDLKKICAELKVEKIFTSSPSFQFASYKKDKAPLQEELKWRKKAGIKVKWLEAIDVLSKFGFSKPAGILSDIGASLDAYALTHALLSDGQKSGMQVYDHTEVISIHHRKRSVELITANKKKITTKKLVIACGYESQEYVPFKIQELQSTFAIISEPIEEKLWYKNALIWETSTPYLYLRTTEDKRILIGGKDIDSSDPNKRDKCLNQKSRDLEKSFSKLFPSIPFRTDFRWAGTFASTKDGLPFIGSIHQRPHTYFALGFGGNGITFSMIAAQIICDLLQHKKNNDARLFAFDR
jgi:glycine/D-amino acid oxidase-like deaminating enzyme